MTKQHHSDLGKKNRKGQIYPKAIYITLDIFSTEVYLINHLQDVNEL